MANFYAAPVLPIADVALFLDLPLSTIEKIRAEGRGPRMFKLGKGACTFAKLIFREWLDAMAKSEAA